MSDLIWVLDSARGGSFGNAGVSSSYILPKNEVEFGPESIAGKRLWVVLRGLEDRLLLFIRVKNVERIIDGYHFGDYWLSSELIRSIKLSSGYGGAAKFATTVTAAYRLGVSQLPQELSHVLLALIKDSIQTKLLPPDRNLLSKIDFQLLPRNDRSLVQSALRAVISHLTLDQVWINGMGDKLGAFSNYAHALLAEKMGKNLSPRVISDLKYFDSVYAIFDNEKPAIDRINLGHTPRVDMDFLEIDPGKICAREFVSSNSAPSNLGDSLKKTEHAEKVHQEMLKDISAYLITNGITPYESNSIDLLYASREKLNVFEIKSSNIENILSQSSKGAFQLACYLNELSKDYENLNAKLILQVIQSPDLQKYAVDALLRLGIEVLFYDPSKPWPNRIQGLPL